MKTKQDIFLLYQICKNLKVRDTIHDGTNLIASVFVETTQDVEVELFFKRDGEWWADLKDTALVPITRCQLILKRISDMSEIDALALYNELGWQGGYTGEKLLNQLKQMFEYSTGWQNMNAELMFTFNESVIVNNFLIRNGYALNDEWFTNGIAIEEGSK